MRFSQATVVAFIAWTASAAAQHYHQDDIYARDIDVSGLYARDAYAEAEPLYEEELYARDAEADAYYYGRLLHARDAYAEAEAEAEADYSAQLYARSAYPAAPQGVPASRENGCTPGTTFVASKQPGMSKSHGACYDHAGQRMHRNGAKGGAATIEESGSAHGGAGGAKKEKNCAAAGKGLVLKDGKCVPSKNCAGAGKTFSAKTGKCV
ncbi:hypothetical protein MMC13_006396 [Lambiella insularis]|nr:hypothetical protein [Lambiella insularis]